MATIGEEDDVIRGSSSAKDSKHVNLIDSDDDGSIEDSERAQFISDFDIMLARKKTDYQRTRKRKSIDLINYNNEMVAALLHQMHEAAEQDRLLNVEGKPATKKIALLKCAMSRLIKKDLREAFFEHNMLSVLADWLKPLPNMALPCVQIRESILKLLAGFPPIDNGYLKLSGIGKAVMYLYKHPSETKANRDRAGQLINVWSRQIFNLSTDYKTMTNEERQQRDLDQIPRNRQPSPESSSKASKVQKCLPFDDAIKGRAQPSDKVQIQRARVPMLSEKVYIVRPKSKINVDMNTVQKKKLNRYETYLRKFNNQKRKNSTERVVAADADRLIKATIRVASTIKDNGGTARPALSAVGTKCRPGVATEQPPKTRSCKTMPNVAGGNLPDADGILNSSSRPQLTMTRREFVFLDFQAGLQSHSFAD
uniref:TFIIS N-terminal domain-containing protein n=1 Tax=Anopheles farauti TaxID=69004 RepID=A0A182Q816_9DIPT